MKKVLFLLAFVVLLVGCSTDKPAEGSKEPAVSTSTSTETSKPAEHEGSSNASVESKEERPKFTQEQKNALGKAQNYFDIMHMSKAGIFAQLTSEYGEKFSKDIAQFAVDELSKTVDWKIAAVEKAKSYFSTMHMSKLSIFDQLISENGEQFTKEEAQYAVDELDNIVDWNQAALEKAKSYHTQMSMSKESVFDQLISEHGEKFTKEQAQYAIDHLDE